MPRPVLNWKRQISGVELLPDFSEKDLFHYLPLAIWLPLKAQKLGAAATSIQGEIKLDLPEDKYADIKAAIATAKLAPLVPLSIDQTLELAIQVTKPHQLSFKVINAFPFPQLMVTGMLKTADPTHDAVLAEIKGRWEARSLFSGSMRASFEVITVEGGREISLNFRNIRDRLASEIGTGNTSNVAAAAAVHAMLSHQFGNISVDLDPAVNGSRLEESILYTTQKILADAFYANQDVFAFDGGRVLEGVRLRDVLEFPVGETKMVLYRAQASALSANLM